MSDYPEPFVFDVQGALSWAIATGNEEKIITADVLSGRVIIYNRVWKELRAAFPDECVGIQDIPFKCEAVTDEHREAAAALADRANATFGRKGPYDKSIEWWMAGIASSGPYTIVTDERRKPLYQNIDGLAVITVGEYLALH